MELKAQQELLDKLYALGIIKESNESTEKKTYEKTAIYRLNNRSLTSEWSEQKEALFKPGITASIPSGDKWDKQHIDSFRAVVIFWAEGRSLFASKGESCGSIMDDKPIARFESPPCKATTRDELVRLISESNRLATAKVNIDSIVDAESQCLNVCGVRDWKGEFIPLCHEAQYGGSCKPLIRVFGWDITNERFFWLDMKGASIKRTSKKDEKTGQRIYTQSSWWDFVFETKKYRDYELCGKKRRDVLDPFTYEVTISPKTDLMKWFYSLNFSDIKFRGFDDVSTDAFELLRQKQIEAQNSLEARQNYKKQEKAVEKVVEKVVEEDLGIQAFAMSSDEINF